MKNKLIYILFLFSSVLYSQNSGYEIVREYYGVEILFDKEAKSYNLKYQSENRSPIRINHLKFAGVISGGRFQVLTQDCEIKYYNIVLDEIKLEPLIVCGFTTEFNPKYEIIEKNRYFFIKKDTVEIIDFKEKIVSKKIDSIKKSKVDDIYFSGNRKVVNELSGLSTIPIIIRNGKKGILENGNAKFYENVEFVGNLIRLTENGLKFYYRISKEPKYKLLEQFEQNLAFFIDQDDKAGYIDINGNEYFCTE
ncbi:MAG: hypothetical protein WDZ45_05185 [Flavobacteriaceae bacterium]